MDSVILGGACGAMRNRIANKTGRQMGREPDRQRLRERKWKRSQEFSHTNPFGQELWVNYSSFVFYLATTVWEWGSSKACHALIDAVWPEGIIQFWKRHKTCRVRRGNCVRNWGWMLNRCVVLGYKKWHEKELYLKTELRAWQYRSFDNDVLCLDKAQIHMYTYVCCNRTFIIYSLMSDIVLLKRNSLTLWNTLIPFLAKSWKDWSLACFPMKREPGNSYLRLARGLKAGRNS